MQAEAVTQALTFLRLKAEQTLESNSSQRVQLPQRERDAAPRIVQALEGAGIVIDHWGWKYLPEVEEWYLLVATRAITSDGPAAVIRTQNEALAKAQIEQDISRRVLLIKD